MKSKRFDDFRGFIDIPLSEDDKASLAAANFEESDAFSFIEEMLEDGYKISISADPAHSSVIATAIGRGADNQNDGYALSGRGPDVLGGLASLAYKHITLCDRGIWTNRSDSTVASKWG